MTYDIPVRCDCRSLQGVLHAVSSARAGRAVCYCHDCQAFAYYLERQDDVLDEHGGTAVVQTTPNRLQVTTGAQHLACVRLTERGTLRWYAACCRTPIGNTTASPKFPFVGLIHSCLNFAALPATVDAALGPVRARAFRRYATGDPDTLPGSSRLSPSLLLAIVRRTLVARMSGAYKRTPFFDAEGLPVATPRRLDDVERVRLPPYAKAPLVRRKSSFLGKKNNEG